ncbi:MAG: HAMP domain-containing histidine kinase [Saccharofermentans sp.]|nr:HAMP domain-containing histidine kinase [Saccharofermentans sp.]
MIKKLRRKFILVSMLSVTVVLVLLIGIINFMSYRTVVRNADGILTMLTDGGGRFRENNPTQRNTPGETNPDGTKTSRRRPAGRREDVFIRMVRFLNGEETEESPEVRYESRFFSVIISPNGDIRSTRTDRISAIDSDTAAEMGVSINKSGRERGFVDDYRFRKSVTSDGSVLVIFYDCGRSLDNMRSFLMISIGISLICLLLVYILIAVFSKVVIRPAAEAYEKQKQFITDAGHELKTPLAIINADADVLEMELPETEDGTPNEWLGDIRKQTARLTELTGNLIYLAKTEEGTKDAFTFVEFPVSDVALQEVESYKARAQATGLSIESKIEDGLVMNGDQRAFRQLIGVFLDNAVKYSADGGTIHVKLRRAGKNIGLSVTNNSKEPVSKDNLKHLFDRFYRADSSHNSATGGYGIGLSIAKSIVEAHKGKITATSSDGEKFTITAVLPS